MSGSAQSARNEVRRLASGIVEYDPVRLRLWVCGQRLHHGMTGAVLASAGMVALAARRLSPRGSLEWTLIGSALMAHDWDDRSAWFRPGHQD